MQTSDKLNLFPLLQTTVDKLIEDKELISPPRTAILRDLANYILQKKEQKEVVKLNFICTHNSRRSHLAQIWAATAAAYYGLNIATYSGGTEATALAPQLAQALSRSGFKVSHAGDDNPSYQFLYALDKRPIICFSKTFDDDINPIKTFTAIMTCTDADENCPFIPGADFRLSLPYEDPKRSDGTPVEAATYDETVKQIGREMFYLMQLVTTSTSE